MIEESNELAMFSANCPNIDCLSHGRDEMVQGIANSIVVCGDCGRWLHNIPEDLTPEQRVRAGLEPL